MRRTALILALSSAACAHTLRVPVPGAAGPGAPLPPPPMARIQAPLSADIRATLARLDGRVPRTFNTGGRYQMIGPSPVGVRYEVTREPFTFTAQGGSLRAETVLSIRAEACVGMPLGIAIPLLGAGCQAVASCGVNEAPRRVVVTADTAIRLDPSWRIVAETRPAEPRFLDRCLLTPFQIDVTSFIAQVVNGEVASATREMDALVAQNGDLRPRAEALWQGLQQPVDLGEGFWLALRPQAMFAAPFALDPAVVRTTVGIVAQPAVLSGAAPADAPAPLPPIQEAAPSAPEGFRMAFDATVGFEEATALVRREYQNHTIEVQGYQVFVRDMRVTGNGAALLFLIDARFDSGPFAGQSATIHMAGLPDWDPARRALVVRDLDYTLETRNALLSVGEFMMRGSLRDDLARKAVFPLGDRIDRVRARAQQALTRELAPGTTLRGTLTEVRPAGAFVTPAGVTLRVEVSGSAEVSQDLSGIHLAG